MESLDDINTQISRLVAKRNAILEAEARAENLYIMLGRGKMVADILFKASTLQEPGMALIYARAFLLPWRHYLLVEYFPCLLGVLPRELPAAWSRAEASGFLLVVSKALEEDRAKLVVV